MSWLQRHLHWSAVLTVAALFPVFALLGFLLGVVKDAERVLDVVTFLGVLGIGWSWVLREKGRSAAWLLLALFVPLGFLCIFLLENRNPRA